VQIDVIVLEFAFSRVIADGSWVRSVPGVERVGVRTFGAVAGGARNQRRAQLTSIARMLVITETAISLVLLAGSGLLIRSFVETMRVQPGFDPHHVLTLRLECRGWISAGQSGAFFFSTIYSLLSRFRRGFGEQRLSDSFSYDNTSRFTSRQTDRLSDMPVSNRVTVAAALFRDAANFLC